MNDYQHRAALFGAEIVDLSSVKFTPELLRCVPAELVRRHRILPVAILRHQVIIAMSDPSGCTLWIV